eukprot:gene27335-4632_t
MNLSTRRFGHNPPDAFRATSQQPLFSSPLKTSPNCPPLLHRHYLPRKCPSPPRARSGKGENLLFDDAVEDMFWLSLTGTQQEGEVAVFNDYDELPSWGPGRNASQYRPPHALTSTQLPSSPSSLFTDRYLRHLFGIFYSATFESLIQPLTLLTGNALVLAIYQTAAENSESLPSWLHGLPILYLGDGPFDLAAYALSLLL